MNWGCIGALIFNFALITAVIGIGGAVAKGKWHGGAS